MYNGHLSIEELEQLNQQKRPAEDQSHIANCRQCQTLLEKYRVVSAKLDQFASVRIGARNGMNCPGERIWFDVAAGTLSSEESFQHVQHAAECEVCGPRLRTATRIFQEESTSEEEKEIGALPSANPKRQKKLAEKLAGGAGNETSQAKEISVKQKPFWRPLSFSLAGVFAVAMISFFGRMIYLQHELGEADRLVASEYQKGRPMQYRVAGVPYGPFREERGSSNIPPSIEVPEEQRHPVLAAQASLLELDPASAIKILENARNSRNDDPAIVDNLVVAYAMQADRTGSQQGYQKALSISDEIVPSHPTAVAYFNRALILERLNRPAEARNAVQQFMDREQNPQWRAEAAQIARQP